jgi:Tol biopolymer transport system component
LKSIPLKVGANCGVAFLPGGQQALVCSLNNEGTIYLVDLQKGTLSEHISHGMSTNGMISIAPDGRHVVSALHNGKIAKCDLKSAAGRGLDQAGAQGRHPRGFARPPSPSVSVN